jgi:UDP-N-acetylglucosamine 4,6-dehydratase
MELKGRTLLITGGTGSFGNRVAAHLLKLDVKEIRILSRDEEKQWRMRHRFPDFTYMLGDVRDVSSLTRAMRGVDIVFHAAALKQVPSCEEFPFEAVKTNTVGSQNVCEAAIAANVQRVVALSTDKAVKPVNAMGMSKALMEKIIISQNLRQSDTVFSCVRYGNVIGTRGSVIPYFRRLIERDEALTVTVPNMTRFLLTLDQAIGMVLHAMTQSKGGEIFVRKAPACTVMDLATTMRQMYSKRGKSHPIEIIGARPGEKLHEVLVNEYEIRRCTEDETFFTVHPEYRPPSNPLKQLKGERRGVMEYTSENTSRLNTFDVLAAIVNTAAKEGEDYI